MKKTLLSLILATCSVLSADYYQDGYSQSSCPNCANGGYSQYQQRQYRSNVQDEPYQNRPYNSNQQGYYNDGNRGQGYNDRGNQGQGYYNDRDNQGYYNGGRNNQGYGNDQRYYNERRNRDSGYQDQNYNDNQDDRRYDDRLQNNQNRRDQPIPDQEISKKIQEAIGPGVFSNGYSNVKFSVNNGNVTLRGSVDTLDEKTKVEESVKKIDGVKQVDNQIRVSGKTAYLPLTADNLNKLKEYETKFPNDKAQSESDRIINARIQEKLNGGWFGKGYPNIALNTLNGNVTVTGYVDSPDDVQKIDEQVKKVEGVKSVNNEVTVKNK